jgi:hypothetical protein
LLPEGALFSFIDQQTGIDMTHCHSDELICEERAKKMTFFVFNEELKSEADVIKLV